MADIPVYESTGETVATATTNGQTVFAFGFLLFRAEQMRVFHRRGSVETELTYPAQFSVSGFNQPNGGSITLIGVSILINDIVVMRRDTPIERLNDWQNEGDYKADLVNREQDTMFMIMQELRRGESELSIDITGLKEADRVLGAAISQEEKDRIAGDKAVASLIGQAGPIETQVFDSQLAASMAVVKPTIGSIRTGGYSSPGDKGDAIYKRVLIEPTHAAKFQSADGAWWEVAEKIVTPQMFGAVADGVTDDTDAILAWASYLLNHVKEVNGQCAGTFAIQGGIDLYLNSTRIDWAAIFVTTTVTEIGVRFFANWVQWTGRLRVECGPGTNTLENFLACRQQIGIQFIDGSRSDVAQLEAVGTQRCGIQFLGGTNTPLNGSSNMGYYAYLGANSCGTSELYFNQIPTSVTNTGGSGSAAQRCTVVFPSTLPPNLQSGDMIIVNGKTMFIYTVDQNTNTVVCFGNADDTSLTEVRFIIGQGVLLQGNNANLIRIGVIDTRRSGVGYQCQMLYGPVVDVLHSANVYYALAIGGGTSINSANINGYVGMVYREGDSRHAIEIATAAHGWRLGVGSGNNPIQLDKIRPTGSFSADFRIRTQTQMLAHTDDVRFNSIELSSVDTLGGSLSTGSQHLRKYIGSPGSGNRYLLICPANSWSSIDGRFYGKRPSSSQREHASVDVIISGRATNTPACMWESFSILNDIRLVQLTYNGGSYYAIDGGASAVNNFAACVFTGFASPEASSVWQWVAEGSVSDVVSAAVTGFHKMSSSVLLAPPGPYADDTAAAAAGVGIGELYRVTGGAISWRQA